MSDRGRYIHLPIGETVTIRIVDPPPTHEIWIPVEEMARYQAMTHDCPLCAAGVPLGRAV